MTEPTELVTYRLDGAVAVISLNRPDKRNAQNGPFLTALDAAWTTAARDPAVKVILLRAEGPHFSAGHDLSEVPDGYWTAGHGRVESGYRWESEHYWGYTRKWRDIPKPSIAAVQGRCIAGGLMLVFPCDLIVAADDAQFSDNTVDFGVGGVEYHGHTWEVGPRKAKEMLFTALPIDAGEALRRGFVNRVVPRAELDGNALELATLIATKNAFGLAQAKRAVNQTLDSMGQYAALQAGFDIHWTGHGNAYALGYDGMIRGNPRREPPG